MVGRQLLGFAASADEMKRLSNLISQGGLVVGSLVVTFVIFEVLCRTIVDTGMHYHLEMWKYANTLKEISPNSAIGHQHIPGARARLMGVDVKINRDGLRDEYAIQQTGEGARILMLGDSITFGWGVPEQDTVATRLERTFLLRYGASVEVINSGVGNYNTAMEVAWYEQEGVLLKPDMVVLNVFINDAEQTPVRQGVAWWDRTLYSRVILFGAFDTLTRTIFGGPGWKDYYVNLYEDDAPGWISMQGAVARLAELCRLSGIPLVIVDYPELRELSPYPFTTVSKKIANLATREGLPYISLLDSVETRDPRSLWVTEPDPHPNSVATEAMVESLAPQLWAVIGSRL